MKKSIFICLLLFSGLQSSQAQEAEKPHRKTKHFLQIGVNIGALTPMGIPNTVREIESFNPGFNPMIGYQAIYQLNEKWSLGAGIKFEYKGMNVKDSVLYFHTIITTGSGDDNSKFEGDFTGRNETNARSAYLTVPVHAMFTPSEKWRFQLGVYGALLVNGSFKGNVSDGYIRKGNSLGEKVDIDEATFDFSDELRTFDIGLQGRAYRSLGKRIGLSANISWGLLSVFPSEFEGVDYPLYNVFGSLGLEYRLL